MILIQAGNNPGPNRTRTRSVHRLRSAFCIRFPNGLQRSDLGLLGRKSDGSSAVPEHPQSQVRITQSSVLRMKPLRASVSARIVGIHQPAVKSNCSTRQRINKMAARRVRHTPGDKKTHPEQTG